MKNIIEIKDNVVCKTYASRMDFVREESLYKKLKGSGLAPELYDSHDGYLEREYVKGENFLNLIMSVNEEESYEALEKYFRQLFNWYQQYRDLTKMTLGKVRFDKFIVSGEKIWYIDFESCKPGYMEDDFARLIAQICLHGRPYSQTNIDDARFFIFVGHKYIQWHSELLYDRVVKELAVESKALGLAFDRKRAEEIATILTSAGIVFAGGENILADVASDLRLMPERYISVPREINFRKISIDNFTKIPSSASSGMLLRRIVEAQRDVREMWTVCVTTDMPRIPPILWSAMLGANKDNYAAVMVEYKGKLREFPLILNTGKTRLELQNALDKGEKSLLEVLSKMPVCVIKVEDVGKHK